MIKHSSRVNLATSFQDLVAKEKNLIALTPVLGAILRPALENEIFHNKTESRLSDRVTFN